MSPCDPCEHLWPDDTKFAELWGAQKGNSSQPNLVIVTICDHQLIQLPTPNIPVTHSNYSSYSSYQFQLLQLPFPVFQLPTPVITVTPVTISSYTSYPVQLPSPVTQTSYFSYVLQLLQLPIPVTQDTQSSCPSYLSYSSYQIPPPSISHRRYS